MTHLFQERSSGHKKYLFQSFSASISQNTADIAPRTVWFHLAWPSFSCGNAKHLRSILSTLRPAKQRC